jgi:hypothetical protein
MPAFSTLGPVRTSRQRSNSSTCAALLSAVKDADLRVETCLVKFERLTNDSWTNEEAFGVIRMNVSQANLARRQVVGRAWAHIVSSLSPEETQAMRKRRKSDIELLHLLSGHIGRWTTAAVTADWEVYCKASRKIKARLGEAIQAEKRQLYPLLERQYVGQAYPVHGGRG